jgi:regulator of protease activity HflC (stomatin/prohibitin superfamily)
MTPALELLIGIVSGAAAIPAIAAVARATAVEVDDEEAVLVTRFGKLEQVLREPGWHTLADKVLPWVKLQRVSLRRDFREFSSIHVNDARGTSVVIDLWLEFRVVDPAKATFAVADWDRALQNLVTHASTSILGNREFHEILCDRDELGGLLHKEMADECERWGIEVDQLFIRNVSLLPEISRQVLETIAARLELAKADLEEEGRQRVALLEAQTSAKVAALVAEAKGQYPQAVGRALHALRDKPAVLAAYNELYELSLLRPQRVIAFHGFDGDVRAVDAAMLTTSQAPDNNGSGVVPNPARRAAS